MQLQNLQADLAEAIINKEITAQVMPTQHIQIYQHHFQHTFTKVLKDCYPLICSLLGEDYFDQVCVDYMRQYPSCSGNLYDYGEYFGQCLTVINSLNQFPYLKEVAQFEWACHRILQAQDVTETTLEPLKQLNEEDYPQIKFQLNPASELIKFNYPILQIIELCKGKITTPIDVKAGGVNLLIVRREYTIKLITLTNGEFYFLQALVNELSLAEALDIALHHESEFKFHEKLIGWVNTQVISLA